MYLVEPLRLACPNPPSTLPNATVPVPWPLTPIHFSNSTLQTRHRAPHSNLARFPTTPIHHPSTLAPRHQHTGAPPPTTPFQSNSSLRKHYRCLRPPHLPHPCLLAPVSLSCLLLLLLLLLNGNRCHHPPRPALSPVVVPGVPGVPRAARFVRLPANYHLSNISAEPAVGPTIY